MIQENRYHATIAHDCISCHVISRCMLAALEGLGLDFAWMFGCLNAWKVGM